MKKYILIFMIVFCLLLSGNCFALSVNTHKEINSFIILKNMSSTFSNTLKNYNLTNGAYTLIKDPANNNTEIRIADIIANGGMSEDDKFRYGNHYHNPLQDWNISGYKGFDTTGSGFLDLLIKNICDSTPVWAQRVDQNMSLTNIVSRANRSWPNARQYFYDALIATDENTRNTNFVNCFTSVGQVMHLLQDMSVPAHVRDDSHAKGNIYEIWVNHELTMNPDPKPFEDKYLSVNPCTPDPSLFKKGPHEYTIPIAGLFDADVYNNPNPDPNLTTGAVGLSEYTNANFLSEDTMFHQFWGGSLFDDFKYPAISSTDFVKVVDQGFTGSREYYAKVRDGESVSNNFNGRLL